MKYDFIEIGTSDFDTLIQTADDDTVGLSIEPLKHYLDKLPSPANVRKVHAAIGAGNGKIAIYHVLPEVLKNNGLPPHLKGCNMVDKIHPAIKKHCAMRKIDPHEIVTVDAAPLMSVDQLLAKYDVEEVDYLKVDTEGYDYIILGRWLELIYMGAPKPKKIQFENNQLTDQNHRVDLCLALAAHDYHVEDIGGSNLLASL